MANHSQVNSLWIFGNVKTIINCIIVHVMFARLDLPTTTQYPIILGCAWLRNMNTTHNWTNNTLIIGYSKCIIIPL